MAIKILKFDLDLQEGTEVDSVPANEDLEIWHENGYTLFCKKNSLIQAAPIMAVSMIVVQKNIPLTDIYVSEKGANEVVPLPAYLMYEDETHQHLTITHGEIVDLS